MTAYHHVPRSEYSPVAPVVVGGVALALIFECSRKPRFRCEKCGSVFSRHTLTSRVFQLLWIGIVAVILLLLAGLLVMIVGSCLRSA